MQAPCGAPAAGCGPAAGVRHRPSAATRASPRGAGRSQEPQPPSLPVMDGRSGARRPPSSPAGRGFTLAGEFDRCPGPRAASKCALTRRACGASRPMRGAAVRRRAGAGRSGPDRRNAPAGGWGASAAAAHAGSLAHGQPSMQRRPPILQTGSSGSSSSGQVRPPGAPRRGAVAEAPPPRGSLPAPPHRPRSRRSSAAQTGDNLPSGPERQGPAPAGRGATLCTGREGLSPVQP